MAYDPNQLRLPVGDTEGGQWTRYLAKSAPPASIDVFRSDNWKSTKETAIIVKDGEPIKTIGQNHKYDIEFSEEEIQLMEDGTLIHNHPGGAAISNSDYVLAQKGNLERIEAFGFDKYTSENVQWVAEKPISGWPAPDTVKSYYKIYESAYIIRARDYMKTNGVDSFQAAHWAANEILTRLADKVGIRMVKNVYP